MINLPFHNHKYLVSIKSHMPSNLEAYQVINKVIKTMVKDSQKIISLNSDFVYYNKEANKVINTLELVDENIDNND